MLALETMPVKVFDTSVAGAIPSNSSQVNLYDEEEVLRFTHDSKIISELLFATPYLAVYGSKALVETLSV